MCILYRQIILNLLVLYRIACKKFSYNWLMRLNQHSQSFLCKLIINSEFYRKSIAVWKSFFIKMIAYQWRSIYFLTRCIMRSNFVFEIHSCYHIHLKWECIMRIDAQTLQLKKAPPYNSLAPPSTERGHKLQS